MARQYRYEASKGFPASPLCFGSTLREVRRCLRRKLKPGEKVHIYRMKQPSRPGGTSGRPETVLRDCMLSPSGARVRCKRRRKR